MITRLTLLTLTLALFTGACTDDKNDTDGGEPTGSETTSTTRNEPTSTTGTTGSEPTSTTGTTGSEPGDTGSEPTTGSEPSTTGEAPPAILPQCELICDKAVTCGLAPDNEGCAEGCSDQYASDTAECAALASTYLDCLAGLSCAQLFDDSICADAEAAWTATCNQFDTCGVGYGGGSGECDLEIDCADEPLRKMTCDAETCTCFIGDQQTGTCAAEAICDDVDGLEQKGETCCQF